MRRIVIIFLLTILCAESGLPQQYPFVHYSPKDGLVNNRTRFMYQDRRGLLYIGTYGGFSVYDGQRFTNYPLDDGLGNSLVNDILELGDDSLLIVSNSNNIHLLVRGQLIKIKLHDDFCPVMNKMVRSSTGTLYALADEGLYRFENHQFIRVPVIDDLHRDAGHYFLRGLEKNGKLFLITDPEVHAFPPPARLVVYDEKTHRALIDTSFFTWNIIMSPDSDLFFPMLKGLRKLDEDALQTGRIAFVPLPLNYKAAQSFEPGYIYFDHEKNFWLTTNEGAWRIGADGKRLLFSSKNGLLVDHVESIFQDRENSIWFANGQTGISKLTDPRFEHYSEFSPGFRTYDLYTSPDFDSTLFLDPVSMKLLMLSGKEQRTFDIKSNEEIKNLRYFVESGGQYFLANQFQIYQAELSGTQAQIVSSISAGHGTQGISSVLPDGHGNLLVLSDHIQVIIQRTKKIISYSHGYFSDQMVLLNNGILWIACRSNHLFKFKIHPEDPDHYFELLKHYSQELPLMGPHSITLDGKGNLWVGTGLQGLFIFKIQGDSLKLWKQLTSRDGLSDNFITYLHTDMQGNIWACTSGGLDKVNLRDGHFLIENITRNQNIYQYVRKVQTDKKGFHWAVTDGGIIRISGSSSSSAFRPSIIFRKIELGPKLWTNVKDNASLPYNENNLNVTVAAPSYIDVNQVRFSYVLEGSSNTEWSIPSPEAEFSFLNLAPGKYTLNVKAEFINGRYPQTEASFDFTIHPPWWQTWWFRLTAFIFVLAVLALVVRNYYRGKLLRQNEKAERQQAIEKERTRIARDMHDDLGSGLSTIRFLTEKIKRNVFSDTSKNDIDKMQETSNDLIDKMNEIIWAMSEKNDSLEDLIIYTRSYVVQYCDENGLECIAELPEFIPAQQVSGEIRRNVFLTVKECLHNIVKHAGAGKVEMVINVSKVLNITVRDDGKGLPKNGHQGNGLRNMHSRVESIGGRIYIQNGLGVTVRMEVPLRSTT